MSETTAIDEPVLDTLELRRAFGTFATGVTIVTTLDKEGRPRGFTANSFSSVSLDPPLLLVCVASTSESCSVFRSSDRFAVSVLQHGQQDISTTFAKKERTKFQHVAFSARHTGVPVLEEALSWFDCSVHGRVDAGDHMILIGRVEAFGTGEGVPLLWCGGGYGKPGEPDSPPAPFAQASSLSSTAAQIIHDATAQMEMPK